MEELLVRNAKKIDENTPIPKLTTDEIFELFQLTSVADLRMVSRNFMRLSLLLNDVYDKFANKYVKNVDLATDTTAGIVTLNKIREVSPRPDLSPYIPFDKGYRNNNRNDWVIRANNDYAWTPHIIDMYNASGGYTGAFHTNGGRAYYKVPGRNSGGWNEIMDNHDMAARDNNIQHAHNRITDTWNRADDAWNKANDAQVNRIYEIRLAGYTQGVVYHRNAGAERSGYVVTGVVETTGDGVVDIVQMRALQFYRNGQWINSYFA